MWQLVAQKSGYLAAMKTADLLGATPAETVLQWRGRAPSAGSEVATAADQGVEIAGCAKSSPSLIGQWHFRSRHWPSSQPRSTVTPLIVEIPGQPGGCGWSYLGCRFDVCSAISAWLAYGPST